MRLMIEIPEEVYRAYKLDASLSIFGPQIKAIAESHLIQGLLNSGWIPVSERLPEKDGRYLAYIINPYDDKLRYSMTCEYFTSEGWCPDDECSSDNVVAWMPLPEPYKEE